MAQIVFTREDAREVFDLLPQRLNEKQYEEQVKHKHVAIVETSNGYGFKWVNYTGKNERGVHYLPIPAVLFYKVVPPQIYKRQGILASVDELYKRVNELLPGINAGYGSKTQAPTKRKKAGVYKQEYASWDPQKWDSGYEPAVINKVEGYMGSQGWEGSKSHLHNNQTPLAQLIRKEIKEAVQAGYLPYDLRYSVKTEDGGMSDVITVTVKNVGTTSDCYPNGRPSTQLQALQKQIERVINGFNYNKSNTMVDYFDRGFYERINFILDDE